MVERDLQTKILEFPSFNHFRRMFMKCISNNNSFQVNIQKNILEKFCQLMSFNHVFEPGPHLGSEDLKNGDVAFCIIPGNMFIRYYFVSISKLKGKYHEKHEE